MFHYVKRRAKEMENVQLTTHADARTFLRDLQTNLEQHEVEHSLILGVALALQGAPASPEIAPYFATVCDAVGLATAAIMIPPHPLALASDCNDCNATLAAIAHDLQQSSRPVSAVVAPRSVADRFAGGGINPWPGFGTLGNLAGNHCGRSIRSTRLLVGSTSGSSRVRSVRSGRALSS
jgi:hypothetical protein